MYMEKRYKTFLAPKDTSNLKEKFNTGSKFPDPFNSIVYELTGQNGNIFHTEVNEFEEMQFIFFENKERR